MSFTNDSKPSGTPTNDTKPGSLTYTNPNEGFGLLWSAQVYPWQLTLPWQHTGLSYTNDSEPS